MANFYSGNTRKRKDANQLKNHQKQTMLNATLENKQLSRSFGTVKWFGGVSGKTGRENNFGFISDVTGKDVFVHRKDLRGVGDPSEDDLVTYLLEETNGKYSARNVEGICASRVGLAELYEALCSPALSDQSHANSEVRTAIAERINLALRHSSRKEITKAFSVARSPKAPSLFEVAAAGTEAQDNYRLLLDGSNLRITDDEPWTNLSIGVSAHFEKEIISKLEEMSNHEAHEKCAKTLSSLSAGILTYLLSRNVYTTPDEIGASNIKRMFEFLSSTLIRGTAELPDYLQINFKGQSSAQHEQSSNPLIRDITDNLFFKKSLFEKTTDFIDIYNASRRLPNNIETFILYNLLGLVYAGNDREVVYSIFMQRLWEALTSKALPFGKNAKKLQALFPSCFSLGPTLSCEAVHWPKRGIFLCRGRACTNPRVLPDPSRHFLDFNIYDWLNHYGIDYSVSNEPQSKDFPIKLASYFNRLREIWPLLHCRSCGELMLPNMKYARTEYKEVVNGVVEVKDMAAAYRLTVFKCNNEGCADFGVGHYISHCVGFGCNHIIDSRDLKMQCSNGRYICKGCGSCCSDHERSHPAGHCSECGSELEVRSQTVRGHKNTYSRKYVKCLSPCCSFSITGRDIPTKFSLIPAIQDKEGENEEYDLDTDEATIESQW